MLITVLLTLAIVMPVPRETNLVGLWESKETSAGGIGRALEFRPDGTYVEATVVLVETPYRIDKDRLVLGDEDPSSGDVMTATIRFEGNSVVQTNSDGTVTHRERMKPQRGSGTSIVGDWRYCHGGEIIAYDRFTDAGKMLIRLPMRSSFGRYSLEKGVLTLESRRRAKTFKVEVRGENLVLSDPTGNTSEYRREPTGTWYALERSDKCVPGVALVLPHARSHPPVERFVGLWRNVDAAATGWPQLEISAKKDTLSIRILGVPGVSTVRYKESPIVLSFEGVNSNFRFILSFEDDVLRMTIEEVDKGGSGRDRVSDIRFRKATK